MGSADSYERAQEGFVRKLWRRQSQALHSRAQWENEQRWTSCGTRQVQSGYIYLLYMGQEPRRAVQSLSLEYFKT